MTTSVKQSADTRCKAKNPATCRYHKQSAPATQLNPFDAFEAAMKRSSGFAKMEAQLMYKAHMFDKLAAAYMPAPVEENVHGFSYKEPEDMQVLEEYNNDYASIEKDLNEEDLEGLNMYTGIVYAPVNCYLRGDDKYVAKDPEKRPEQEASIQKTIQQLDGVFRHTKKKPRRLYRVLTQDTTKEFMSAEDFAQQENYKEGETVSFKSYLSTSIDPRFMARVMDEGSTEHVHVVFVIDTDEGIPVSRTALSHSEETYTQSTEREILLPRDMSFAVTKVTRATRFHVARQDEQKQLSPLTVYLKAV